VERDWRPRWYPRLDPDNIKRLYELDAEADAFVPATPFPPDDRSYGYERGTSISKTLSSRDISA
jgi:hypothetical protein